MVLLPAPPTILAHAGEEVLYVLIPAVLVALVMWLDRRAKEQADSIEHEKPDTDT